MPYDVVAANRQATQSGLALGQAMFNNAYRMQQLRSEEATRRLEERFKAAQLSNLLQQQQLAIDERAEMAKATAALQAETLMTMPVQGPPVAGGAELPDVQQQLAPTAEQIVKHYLPVIGKYRPQEADNFLANTMLYDQRRRSEQFQPRAGAVTTPSGRTVEYFQGGPNSAQPVYQPGIVNLTDPETGKSTSVIQTGNSVKQIPQDIEGRQLRVGDVRKLKDLPGGAALLEWDDGKGAFVLPARNAEAAQKILSSAGNITTPVRTMLEKQQAEVGKVFALGKQLAPLLTPENVGVKGMATRAFEGVAAQLVPGFKIGKATDTVATAKEFQAALIKGLKSDSNIAEPERKTLEVAFPTPQNWFEGAPQSKAKLATALHNWGTLSRNNAGILGKPIMPQWLTRDEIRTQLANQQIDEETADRLMEDNGWALIDALRADALR